MNRKAKIILLGWIALGPTCGERNASRRETEPQDQATTGIARRQGPVESGEPLPGRAELAERIAVLEVRVEQLAAEVLRGSGEATAWSGLHLDMTDERVEILLGEPSRHDRLPLSPRLRYIARLGDDAPEANGPTLHIMAYGNPPGRVGIVLLLEPPYAGYPPSPARVICWIRSRE
jgi:uncharacterized small protein (DUF1192 family)